MGKRGHCNSRVLHFFYGKEHENHQLETGYLVHHRIPSAVKRAEFLSDRMSFGVLRGRWCNITVLNVHAPCEEKSDDSEERFYENLEKVFDNFPNYHNKILSQYKF
jgi:hypothetical protein